MQDDDQCASFSASNFILKKVEVMVMMVTFCVDVTVVVAG